MYIFPETNQCVLQVRGIAVQHIKKFTNTVCELYCSVFTKQQLSNAATAFNFYICLCLDICLWSQRLDNDRMSAAREDCLRKKFKV